MDLFCGAKPAHTHASSLRLTKDFPSMLFCDRLSDDVWANAPNHQRKHQLRGIMKDFALSFAPISFRLELNFNLINAQAVTTAAGRHVNIYGGLAFHPKLGPDSLVLATLHEVGYHLSEECRSHHNVTLACECAADYWSVTEGTYLLRKRSGKSFRLDSALDEFSRILPHDPNSVDQNENQPPLCWSHGWPARKRALLKQSQIGLFCCQR